LLSPHRKVGALRDGAIFLFAYVNYSLICLSPMHTCWAMADLPNSAEHSHEWPQHCWATRTSGVPDVSSSVKNFTRMKFKPVAGAYS